MGLLAANGFGGSRPIPLHYRRATGFFWVLIVALGSFILFGLGYLFPMRADFRSGTLFSTPILLFLYGGFFSFYLYALRYIFNCTGRPVLLG